jgi:hypothetical protein
MAIITIPSSLGIRNLKWSQPPTYQTNRSDLTGATRTVSLGPAERWFASGTLVPVNISDLYAVRAFKANMKRPDNYMRLPMLEQAQALPAGQGTDCLVNGAGQLGYELDLKGLLPATVILQPGTIIMVVLDSIDWQPIVLADFLTSDGAGAATAKLTTPLRKSPENNAGVNLSFPVCTMRMRDPLAWEATPGLTYDMGDFIAEEWF